MSGNYFGSAMWWLSCDSNIAIQSVEKNAGVTLIMNGLKSTKLYRFAFSCHFYLPKAVPCIHIICDNGHFGV